MKELLASIILSTSQVVSVYDGDTFFVDLPLCHQEISCDRLGVRVRGVDTPEIKGKCESEKELAIKARDFVRDKIDKARIISLNNMDRGAYFRIVADVNVDGQDLASMIIDKELGRKQGKEKRKPWCPNIEDDVNIKHYDELRSRINDLEKSIDQ